MHCLTSASIFYVLICQRLEAIASLYDIDRNESYHENNFSQSIQLIYLRAVGVPAIAGPCPQEPLVYFDIEKDECREGNDTEQHNSERIEVVFDVNWIVSEKEIKKIAKNLMLCFLSLL